MNKKLFPLISILVLLTLFGSAMTCNMCGFGITTPTTATEAAVSETIDDQTDGASSETAEDTVVEETKDNAESSVTASATETSKETASEETAQATNQTEIPTIKLETYEGPTYSPADKTCFYKIKAIVTGNPSPTVKFVKDDSNGSLGSNKAKINLTINLPSYTLMAKATNSAGEATASISLTWGCPPIPTVEKTVEFHPSDMGQIGPNLGAYGDVFIGDSYTDSDTRGRFAFDVSSIAGKDIIYAKLTLKASTQYGSMVDFKGPILIFYNNFLPGITQSDYYDQNVYGGPETFAWDADPLEFSNNFLKEQVKKRADSGVKLQFGIGYQDINTGGKLGVWEGIAYKVGDITLTVKYSE